jgi:AmmeMemoRadiSam system protein A
MHPYCQLALDSITYFLEKGETMKEPKDLPEELQKNRAGVFVSLHLKTTHALRGCIGTFLPTQENLANEIIVNSVSAATGDPRFMPVTKDELNDLEINVDVLSEPKDCEIIDLDPKKFGVIVKTEDGRKGLLLPDLEGIDKVENQLEIACGKAGIDYANEKFEVMKFTVERYI